MQTAKCEIHALTDKHKRKFWSNIEVKSEDECWNWQTWKTDRGYGRFRFGKEKHAAHRAAWILINGAIPPAMLVCHKCDNPACCNPAHLFIGTASDNMMDMVRKNRHFTAVKPERIRRGIAIQTSKFTDKLVREIRREIGCGNTTAKQVALKHGVHESTISNIVRGKTWTHVWPFNAIGTA